LQAVANYFDELNETVNHLKAAARNTPGTSIAHLNALRKLEESLKPLSTALNGDQSISKREYITVPGLRSRMGLTTWSSYYNSSEPTNIQKENLKIVTEALPGLKQELKKLEEEINIIKESLYSEGAPFLKGDLK
jgi:hypothetical protein